MYGVNDFTTELEDVQYSPVYINELEHKIKVLEHQNASLVSYKQDYDRLSIELQHIVTLKDAYEEKFNEASMKLICIDDDDSLLFTETEQLKTLTEKVSVLLHTNEDLRKEIQVIMVEVMNVKKERDEFKTELTNIQKLYRNISRIEKNDKEIMTDSESLHSRKRKSVSIYENINERNEGSHVKHKSSLIQTASEKINLSIPGKNKVLQAVNHPKQEDQFSRTIPSHLYIPNPSDKLNSPTLATSESPFARNLNSPKLKPSLSRQSPKVKAPKKPKTVYIPSFLRKSNKQLKK